MPEHTIPSAPGGRGGRRRRTLRLAFLAILVLLLGGCLWYLESYYHADEAAIAAFSAEFNVEEHTLADGSLRFGSGNEACGLIFYPGGKVEHTAYAPLMRELASQGVFCVLCEMPLRLAVLDKNAAAAIPDAFPQVGQWYLGGHSLGGNIAASCLAEHREAFAGLVLLAAYSTDDLSDTGLRALCVRGSEDGVLNQSRCERCRAKLPPDAEEVVISGGCHAYFGMYGPQCGDGTPTISNAEQLHQTAAAILTWMQAGASCETERGNTNAQAA